MVQIGCDLPKQQTKMIRIKNWNRDRESAVNEVIHKSREMDDDYIELAEVKEHLNVDFADKDDYIESLIPVAREWAEERTGRALVPSEVTAIIRNEISGFRLPWPPYVDSLVLKDTEGETISDEDYEIKGDEIFQYSHGEFTATYNAGYDDDTLPKALRMGVKEYIKYLYNPEKESEALKNAMRLTAPFITKSWII